MKKYAISILAALALGALSFGAMADPIGGPNRGTCQGSIYAFTYSGTALTTQIRTIRSGSSWTSTPATPAAPDDLSRRRRDQGVELVRWCPLFAAPGGRQLDPNGWRNQRGCNGSGSGFVCADFISTSPPGAALGGILEWAFDVTVKNGGLLTGANAASIKARYVNSADVKVAPSSPRTSRFRPVAARRRCALRR